MGISCYEIILTKSAKKDLEDIYDYISNILKEPTTANNLMKRIENNIFNLERLPYRHPEVIIKPHNKKFRRLVVNKYIVLYKIDEKRKKIHVYNVIYGSKDYLN